MRTVVVDKIASVTQALRPGARAAHRHDDIPSEEGVVLVVEILTNKSTYNTLELTSGRMAKVEQGRHRRRRARATQALFGYSGHVPPKLEAGDIIQMLNIGGVLGICDSANPDKGKPFDCRVLGVVLQFPYLGERIGVPARVGYAQARLRRDARHAGRAGRRARGHLHGGRQDRRRLRDRRRACAIAA